MKKDIPLFVLGVFSTVTVLCCLVLQAIPMVRDESIEVGQQKENFWVEPNDIAVLSAELVENDYSDFLGQKFAQASSDSAEDTVSIAEEYNPVPNSVEMTLSGGTSVDNFFVNAENGTAEVDFNALLEEKTRLQVSDGGITVLLYHTHTCEAYANNEDPTLTRTDDPEKSVVTVGEAMKKALEEQGISVIHDTTIHDMSYTGSYARSEATVLSYLEQYPEIDIVIDLHRDSLASSDEERIRSIAEVNGKKAAQVMIISGCDPDGTLGLPNWRENLKLALRLQQSIADISPDLGRPLFYCTRNYNQNLSIGALLIEFGTDANRIEEAVYSGELVGQALSEVIKSLA